MALISGRYATALFDLALEQNCVDKFYDDVKLVKAVLASDKEIITVLEHPQISTEDKLNILKTAFSDKISEDIIGFFAVIFKKNRENELMNILTAFLSKAEEYKGIAFATVESAEALSEDVLTRIEQKLSNKLNKQVKVEAKVAPELLGGLRISVEGHIIDNTIKYQISKLRKQLLSAKLAQ